MSLLQQYGISLAFLQKNSSSSELAFLEGESTEQEVMGALRHLVPKRSGVKLIRIGGHMDGGYLVPDDLDGIEACFSPGTNNFKRFEDELLQNYNIRSFMCDFSSDVFRFQTPLSLGMQFFEKKWLDVDGAPDSINLNDWVRANASASTDLILQMDIEGAEYRNLLAADPEILSRFRIIILELHDLQALAHREFLHGVFLPAMQKIASSHVSIHVHANNCCGHADLYPGLSTPRAIEITYLRKDRLREQLEEITIPNPLDELNVNRAPPIALRGLWLGEADEVRSRLGFLEQSIAWLTERVINLTKYNAFFTNRAHLFGNVALGKPATQSSLSAYSTELGASGAVNGTRDGRFGFHTAEEQDPWWMVDLKSVHQIDACLVFNRMDGASVRADTLQVLTSLDSEHWTLNYEHSGKPTFGGITPHDGEPPLLVDMTGVKARFIKLRLVGYTALHLDEVAVFGQPEPV